jgi:hypothetical protein
VIQNPNARAIEKANNGNVVPRRFFAYAVYDLPFGKGHHLLGNAPAVVQQVLGGWRTTWTAVMQSGQYFTPSFSGFDPSGTGTIGGVPDRVGDGNLPTDTRNVRHWFDQTAFAVPGCPATTPLCSNPAAVGRFGNSGFNIVAGPPIRNLDFGLLKEFRAAERFVLRFTLTMANALNHPNFTVPASNISSTGTVGVISSQTRPLLGEPGPREVDFGLRLTF